MNAGALEARDRQHAEGAVATQHRQRPDGNGPRPGFPDGRGRHLEHAVHLAQVVEYLHVELRRISCSRPLADRAYLPKTLGCMHGE